MPEGASLSSRVRVQVRPVRTRVLPAISTAGSPAKCCARSLSVRPVGCSAAAATSVPTCRCEPRIRAARRSASCERVGYPVLCCAMPCWAMLCYAMLCFDVLCYDMLCYAVLCCDVLCYAVLWCGVVWCGVVCCAVLCCAVVCCGVVWYGIVCYACERSGVSAPSSSTLA